MRTTSFLTFCGYASRWFLLIITAGVGALMLHCGCGASSATSSTGGTNSITGTVQAPTIGIFGNVAASPEKSIGTKALANSAVANATVCAYNLVSGTKIGCSTTDSSGTYTIANVAQSTIVDPNNTAQARVVIEATTSDGLAKIYDYEDVAVSTTLSAGTADSATTNAFVLGTLTEIRKVDTTWTPGSAAPSSFVDRVKGGTFDPGCKSIPYAGLFSDSDVSVSGSGLGGSLGVVSDMLKAGLGRTIWKTLGYTQPADFTYDAMNNKLSSSQIGTWAAAVAGDLSTTAAALESSFSSAMAAIASLETVFGSVLSSDVGLSARSGRTSTLCARFKNDTVAMSNWVDTLAKYGTTSLLEKHWGSASAFSAAAKFIEEFDDDDVWTVFQPDLVIGMLGSDFSADTVTDSRVNVGSLILTKGIYTDITAANKQDIGADLWKFMLNASATQLTTMDDNPAFWIGYVLKYFGDLTSSSNYSNLIANVIDNADDVSNAACESDPKGCVTTAGAETPTQGELANIAGTYAFTFGTATGNTCAAAALASCPHGTLTMTQGSGNLTLSYAPADASTTLTGTGSVASSSSWTATLSRSETSGSCSYTRSLALGGVPSPFSTLDTTTTITRAGTSSSIDCAGVINNSSIDTNTTCTFTCTTSATKQ